MTKQDMPVTVSIQIDVGDERIYDGASVGTAEFAQWVIDSAIEVLGKAEQHWVPKSVNEQLEGAAEYETEEVKN